MRLRTFLSTVLLCLIIFFHSAFAQEGYEHFAPVAHGAGRTYVVLSSGLSAVGLNPSLIEPDNNKSWMFDVFPVSSYGVDAGPTFFNTDSLANIFNLNITKITNQDRKQISNALLSNKLSGRADVQIAGVEYHAPSLGTFALTWTTHASARTAIPDQFLNFFIIAESSLLQGSGSYSNFDLQGMWYTEYSITYAKEFVSPSDKSGVLNSLKLGGAVKYVSGTAYIGLDPNNSFQYNAINGGTHIALNYVLRSAYSSQFDPKKVPTSFSFNFITSDQAGSGYGFDLGASAELFGEDGERGVMTVGASVTDIGSISWTQNATTRTADHLSKSIYANTNIQDLNDSLKSLSGVLSNVSSFSTSLPTMFRLGASFNLDKMSLTIPGFASRAAIEYDKGLSDVVGSLNNSRIGVGLALEQYNTVASLRLSGGFFIEQDESDVTLAAGTTLFDHIMIDLASAHIGQIFKSGSKRTDVALSFKLLL